jgi:integrase
MKRLTDKLVAAMRNGSALYDSLQPGLLIEASKAGRRVWQLQLVYHGNSSQSKRTLGTHPALLVDPARIKAAKWSTWVSAGIDPKDGEKAERVTAAAESNSFGSVCETFLAEREAWTEKQRSLKSMGREIRRELVPEWGNRPIKSITPSDVRTLIAKVRRRSEFNARKAWSQGRLIFAWAAHNELVASSPFASLDRNLLFRGARLAPRQTTLDDDHVVALWRCAGRLNHAYGPFYRALLLTGLRRDELGKAKWTEINPEMRRVMRDAAVRDYKVDWTQVPDTCKVLVIPAHRFKSNVDHVVPLANATCEIFENMVRFQGCDWIFTETGKVPINHYNRAKQRLDKRMLATLRAMARKRGLDPSEVKLTPWVNHDLRRVLRTGLSALQVQDHVAEMALGHGKRGLARVYDLHRYLGEIRAAMELWADRVSAITGTAGGSPKPAIRRNVLAFAKAAGGG